MSAENNVAAQAGDEPMWAGAEAAFERYLAKQKYIVGMPGLAARPCYCAGYQAGLEAAQVSPRATADVERLDFIEANPELRLQFQKKRWALRGFTSYEFPVFKKLRDAIDAAIATTKPGA